MKGNNVPNYKQFYKEDYKTRDYGTMMHEYEKTLEHNNEKMNEKMEALSKWKKKTAKLKKWTLEDQALEEQLWVS